MFCQSPFIRPSKLNCLGPVLFCLWKVAFGRVAITNLEQTVRSEVFEFFLLRNGHCLLRIVFGLRVQTTRRIEITQTNQGSDLLSFVAQRSCGVERLLKLLLCVV